MDLRAGLVSASVAASDRWLDVRRRLRSRGLRWTPQREVLLDVLAGVDGHVTGAELVERTKAIDPSTTPSTVYRTLDVLEDLGLVSHSHGIDGRQEFHIGPSTEHAHLLCSSCGAHVELRRYEVQPIADEVLLRHGFDVDLDHLTIEGRCADCRRAGVGSGI
jgi:Fur family ferric uptake transcriptional regulator